MALSKKETDRLWEEDVAACLRNINDLIYLESSRLGKMPAVKHLARQRYPGKVLAMGRTVRDLLQSAATDIALDEGTFRAFILAYSQGTSISEIARTLRMNRVTMTQKWRPKAVQLIGAQVREALAA